MPDAKLELMTGYTGAIMRKILIATTNHNKISRIKRLLADVPVEIISLADLPTELPEPAETADSGIAIAAQKALGYVQYVDEGAVVLTQDDTISFEGVASEDNPGAFIKEPVRLKYGDFTDDNAIKYYTDLAKKYGGTIPMTFRYGHAIAYKTKTDRQRIKIVASSSELSARLVSTPRKPELVPGYFLSSIMQLNINGEWIYYTELNEEQKIKADDDIKISILSLLQEVL